MILRPQPFFLMIFALLLICPWAVYADEINNLDPNPPSKPMVAGQPSEEELSDQNAFVKPYEYERQALGYDPDGIIYRENQPEDFQVVFITSLPFAALASFGLTGLTSMIVQGQFSVGGSFFLPFLGGMAIGATTVACVSVLSNPYPPPDTNSIVELPNAQRSLAFLLPLMTARF
ncbi:MAG TPA: hypothetical protein VN963_05390 [bacterium]|nr:hypothetical protein [bacterium]